MFLHDYEVFCLFPLLRIKLTIQERRRQKLSGFRLPPSADAILPTVSSPGRLTLHDVEHHVNADPPLRTPSASRRCCPASRSSRPACIAAMPPTPAASAVGRRQAAPGRRQGARAVQRRRGGVRRLH